MEGIDPLVTAPVDPFCPGTDVPEQVDDDFTDEQVTGLSDYPPLAKQNKCAKDWDFSLLQNCTSNRLRHIARSYENVLAKLNKPEMYTALYQAMLEVQDCNVCNGCDCNPATHQFPPIENPPPGYTGGPDGIFTKPPSLTRAESFPGGQQIPPGNPPQSTPAQDSSQQQPGIPVTQAPPAPSQGQNTTYQASGFGSPSNGLIRPTGSLDLPVATTVSSYIPGVYQPPPQQRDPAQFVTQGAAALAAAVPNGTPPASQVAHSWSLRSPSNRNNSVLLLPNSDAKRSSTRRTA